MEDSASDLTFTDLFPPSLVNPRQLIVRSALYQTAGEVSTFWIQLDDLRFEDLRPHLTAFVRSPSGLRYNVFISRDPSLENPNQLRCVWRSLETGLHKGVVFLGEEHFPGSPFLIHCQETLGMDTEDEDSSSDLEMTPCSSRSRIQPRRLNFSDAW
jgi:hypothetical protein